MNAFLDKHHLSSLAKLLNIEYRGQDPLIQGFSTDTRTVSPGDLFIALPGERVDGHAFIKEAEAKGASGLLVCKPVESKLPKLEVKDTLKAMGVLAKAYRQQFSIPLCAITGSCGKTTVKEMVVSILSVSHSVLATKGNLNTEVGVPLTLLRLEPHHQLGVIEMGARKKGDIAYLMELTHPTVSLITNAGIAHVEIFGNEQGIAEAKGEIYKNLLPSGIAVINQDDAHAAYWRSLLKGQSSLSFGFSEDADVTCFDWVQTPNASTFQLKIKASPLTKDGVIPIQLSVPGQHNVVNALAAAATAHVLGASLSDIQKGLAQFVPVVGRLQFKSGILGVQVIDDSYNANPVSMRAALAVLAKSPGKRIFVMGDMFELGEKALTLHQEIGVEAKQMGIDCLLGVGELTAYAVKGFGLGASHYQDKPALIQALKPVLKDKSTVLVKGSRGMRMEEVVLALTPTQKPKG